MHMRQFQGQSAGIIVVPVMLMLLILIFPSNIPAAQPGSAVPKMRPYVGIGILHIPISFGTEISSDPLYLYEEPALSRLRPLNKSKPPSHEWIFGSSSQTVPFIVMARKGKWLLVTYDDAGREAWLAPGRQGTFQKWDAFFKGQSLRMLPGLQKRFYQIWKEPGAEVMSSVTPRQAFRVLRVEGDWLMVMADQNNLGWLRWRDDDGRLLVGLEQVSR